MAALLFPRLLAVCFLIAPIATMPGAPFYVPTDSYKVPQAARFAVAAFNAKGSPEMYAYKLTAILSSQIQVVEGLNYILTTELGLTWCMKSQAWNVETCPLQVNGKRLLCRFIVYTIPWMDRTMLTEKTCIDSPLHPRYYRRSLTQGTR